MSRKLGLRMWLRRARAAVWLGFGLTTLIMLAGLHDIPKSYYEVAELEERAPLSACGTSRFRSCAMWFCICS